MARTSTPRVSIGLPVYNGERYLAETIDTILGQTFGDLELIISDNASTDATGEIAQRYATDDPRVRYIRNPHNVGAARNYSQLPAFARGEYFKWAGYDDLLLPTHLERCVAALDADPGLALAYPRTDIIDADGKVVREHDDNLHLDALDPVDRVRDFAWRFTLCNPCFGVQRRDAVDRTSLIQPFVSSDIPYLVEMAILGRWHEVPERLFLRRIHDTSSRQGKVTMVQVAQWFAPGSGRPLAPRNRMVAECVRSIMRSDLDPPTKSRAATAFLSAWAQRRARVRGGQAKAALKARRQDERGDVEVPA